MRAHNSRQNTQAAKKRRIWGKEEARSDKMDRKTGGLGRGLTHIRRITSRHSKISGLKAHHFLQKVTWIDYFRF
jgi:hypothetical protein